MAVRHWSLAVVAAVALMSGCSSSKTVRAASVRPNQERNPAPEFELKDVNGHVVRLADYRGKVVLLDFWATWCGPCKIEIPWFKEFERQNKDKGFAVIGVAMDEEGWDVVKPFASSIGINYRLVLGDEKLAEQYGKAVPELHGDVEALPTTFLIDRGGKIASVHIGLASKRDFEDGIETLLQASGPSVPAVLVRSK